MSKALDSAIAGAEHALALHEHRLERRRNQVRALKHKMEREGDLAIYRQIAERGNML